MVIKYPCSTCLKAVRNNQKSILCAKCNLWTHVKCCHVSMEIFHSDKDWFRSKCLFDELPTLDVYNETTNLYENSEGNHPSLYNSFDSTCKILNNHSDMNIMHLNICSLYRCIDEVRSLFEQSQYDVLSFSETMLDDSIPDACVNINDYSMIRKDRNRNGGGIIVYVKKNIIFKIREDLVNGDIEMLVLEIDRERQKPLLVCVWNRPPNSSPFLFDDVNHVFDKIEGMNLDVILLGDFNCDVSSKNPNTHTKRLLEFADNYHLTQVIDKPTRVTQTSSTVIDLIFTSDSNKVNFSDVVQIGLSDHYMVTVSWGRAKRIKSDHKYVISRAVNKMDVDNFKKVLSNQHWHEVLAEKDAERAYNLWIKKGLPQINMLLLKREELDRRACPGLQVRSKFKCGKEISVRKKLYYLENPKIGINIRS